jgi:NAD(P)-dependent dehydrogenase (short-subunit alcohol dehydrogenase family)
VDRGGHLAGDVRWGAAKGKGGLALAGIGRDKGAVREVLVLGGYGGFGGRAALLLAGAGFAVTVAGRGAARAKAFCDRHPGLRLRPLALDRESGLCGETPWLVVDAAGPFQGCDYRLPLACIAARCHYLDLADARDFVTGIGALDEAAKAAGVTIIAGASSLPALSAAVCDRLSEGLDRISAIDAALSAGNGIAGGASVTRAILSYVGRPLRLWRGQRWRRGYGWQEMGRVRFAVPGHRPLRRLVALCEVPDLELLPARYEGRPAVRFRAGTELALQNLLLWLLSWPVRWGLLRGGLFLTRPAIRLQRLMGGIGGDRSAMRIVLKGWQGERAVRRTWTIVAEHGDGPWIPALAALLLAGKLAQGLPPGARDAAGSLTLGEFEGAFARFAIATGVEESRPTTLYARIMGADFARLPAAVRALHLVNGDLGASGMAQVTRGTGLLARLIGRIMGFPAAGTQIPVSVWMREEDGVETWRREFDGAGFSSRLSQRGPLLVERFGAIRFAMDLRREPDGLSMPFRRWWIGPVPMPRFLLPRDVAREYQVDGRFHFDVPIALPLIGPVIHYKGWLNPLWAG